MSHGRQVQYCGKLTLSLGTTNVLPCPTFTGSLRGVKHVLICVNSCIKKAFLSARKSPLNPSVSRPKRMSTQPYRPPHVRKSGARVSALLRRGAAPYADGCERHFGHSHLISLLPFAVLGLSSRLTWHDFAYVTMAQKVPSSTLAQPFQPYPSFLERSAPHIPVAQDPPLQPPGISDSDKM